MSAVDSDSFATSFLSFIEIEIFKFFEKTKVRGFVPCWMVSAFALLIYEMLLRGEEASCKNCEGKLSHFNVDLILV